MPEKIDTSTLKKATEILGMMSFQAEEAWDAALLNESRNWSKSFLLLLTVWFGGFPREETAELCRIPAAQLEQYFRDAMVKAHQVMTLPENERFGSQTGMLRNQPWKKWDAKRLTIAIKMVRALEEHPSTYWKSPEGAAKAVKLLKERFTR